MKVEFRKTQIAVAVATALSAAVAAPALANGSDGRQDGTQKGTYLSGDFHNHTTCSDGSISMQKLVKKATDKKDTPWGLDWFVQAGHGGNGTRNCTLAEDASLATPAYPLTDIAPPAGQTNPNTTWATSIGAAAVKGNTASTAANSTTPLSTQANPAMWRWQSVQEYQYPLLEYLSALRSMPLFIGIESVVAGHEHTSMSVITGQMPHNLHAYSSPKNPPYVPLGNATALAQWSYCFDRGDTDNSRGGGQGWDCSVAGSANAADASWNATAAKLVPATGTGSGTRGHLKTVEAVKWMAQNHPNGSYYVPAHLERAGPFNPDGNNGFNIEHLRNFNNAAPAVAFGMETQPGHGASDARGEYTMRRNGVGSVRLDSVGGATYGGTGVYGAQIGGVWDALLGEGRNWWFFASSDWHNRGTFGPDDRRSTQDFYPGEYQRDYVKIAQDSRKPLLSPQAIVDGLRTGNSWASSGQIIDRLAFVVCADTRAHNALGNALVEAAALAAAKQNTDVELNAKCATMGEKLQVSPGSEVVVAIAVRDPAGTNYSPYTFANPSLAQIDVQQPLNKPVLDHIDVIGGLVKGYKQQGAADYSGQWPNDWIQPYLTGGTPTLASVPEGAKNTSASVLRTFGKSSWKSVDKEYKVMTFRIRAVSESQYLRLRGTNLPASVPYETDADGNPLPDVWTNAGAVNSALSSVPSSQPEYPEGYFLKIPCTTVGTNVPDNGTSYTGAAIDGCPAHLPTVGGVKYSAYDVAAWSDLWFYSNPIFIEVKSSTLVAGVK